MKVKSKTWHGCQQYRSNDVEIILPEREENVLDIQSIVDGRNQREVLDKYSENVIRIIYLSNANAINTLTPICVYNYQKKLHCIYEPIAFERDIRPFSTYWRRNYMSDGFSVYYELRSAFKIKNKSGFDNIRKVLNLQIQDIKKEMIVRRILCFKRIGIVRKDMSKMLFRHPEQEVEILFDGSKILIKEIDKITYAWMLGQRIYYYVDPQNVEIKIISSYENKEDLVEITDGWQKLVSGFEKNQIPIEWFEALKNRIQED